MEDEARQLFMMDTTSGSTREAYCRQNQRKEAMDFVLESKENFSLQYIAKGQ